MEGRTTRYGSRGEQTFKCSGCGIYVEDIHQESWLCYPCLGQLDVTPKQLEMIADALETFIDFGIYTEVGVCVAEPEEVTALYDLITERLVAINGKEKTTQ